MTAYQEFVKRKPLTPDEELLVKRAEVSMGEAYKCASIGLRLSQYANERIAGNSQEDIFKQYVSDRELKKFLGES